MDVQEQSYRRHTRLDPAFHMVAMPLAFLNVVGSLVYVVGRHTALSFLLLASSLALILALTRVRLYATRLQDRVVRIEENFRHFTLTGRPLDAALTMDQIIALRFAGDDEFAALCARAVRERLSKDAIKQAVTHWRADRHRV